MGGGESRFPAGEGGALAGSRSVRRACYIIARRLLALKESLEDVESEMTQLLAAHSLSKVFLSLPGAGKVTAAKLIALIGDNKQRFGSANNMGCLFGTAPRNYQSGSYHKVSMRRACKKRGSNDSSVFRLEIKNGSVTHAMIT